MDVEKFVCKQLELLELERDAEIEESRNLQEGVPSKELQRLGLCLRKLKIASKNNGLYNRTLIKMEPQWSGKVMPAHNLSSGDIVGITSVGEFGHQNALMSGIVWKTSLNSITIAFEASFDAFLLDDHSLYGLIKLANDVTYRRIRGAMDHLRKYRIGCASRMIEVLFGLVSPSEPIASLPKEISNEGQLLFLNASLDLSQKIAVDFALRQREISIVHGPPGTGKTTTIVEIIRQSIAQGLKILACAPSNVAVDNLTERLSNCGIRIVRLGHPARSLFAVHDVSLDALVYASDNSALVDDIRSEVEGIQLRILKSKSDGERRRLRTEIKSLSHELRARETAALREVLRTADVVLATLTSSHQDGPLKHLDRDHFDVVVIDECSQALEAACWIPLLRAPKCILAGDHLQLPPTIISEKAAKGGFEVTLMERLIRTRPLDETSVKMLTTQYRMNQAIMQWSSLELYAGRLVAHSSVESHLLCHLSNVSNDENTSVPLVLIDTAGCDLYEMEIGDDRLGISKGNLGEAKLVAIHVERLVTSGLDPKDIAVIAPYNLQVELLRSLLSSKYPILEIKSVDGFQGREKEAVILTLVRSNTMGDVGFLSEDRRINVAITRARRHLAVVCDGDTVSKHPFLKKFVEYLYSVADVRSAHQYQSELDSDRFEVPTSLIRGKINSSKTTKTVSKVDKVVEKTAQRPKLKPEKQENKREPCASNDVQQDESCRPNFEQILENFAADTGANCHKFPPTLNSFERFTVHEVAEKLGLFHVSHGDGEQRHITVSKSCDQLVPVKTNKIKSHSENVDKREAETASSTRLKEKNPASKGNQLIRNSVNKRERCKKETGDLKVMHPKNEPKEIIKLEVENENIVLDKAVRENKKCGYPKCKDGFTLLRQVCPLCKIGFCLSHHIPEIHGCGEAAHKLARQRISREGVIVPGSGEINRRPSQHKRVQLEKKLEKKLTELGGQRNRKKRGGNEK